MTIQDEEATKIVVELNRPWGEPYTRCAAAPSEPNGYACGRQGGRGATIDGWSQGVLLSALRARKIALR